MQIMINYSRDSNYNFIDLYRLVYTRACVNTLSRRSQYTPTLRFCLSFVALHAKNDQKIPKKFHMRDDMPLHKDLKFEIERMWNAIICIERNAKNISQIYFVLTVGVLWLCFFEERSSVEILGGRISFLYFLLWSLGLLRFDLTIARP